MSSRREAYRIRPIKRACMDCHARKVKCDGTVSGFPCSNCRSAQVECVIAQRQKRKQVSAQRTTSESGDNSRGQGADSHHEVIQEATTTPRIAEEDPITENEPTLAPGEYAGECELAKEHLVEFFSQDLRHNPIRARSTYVGSELSNLNYLTRQRSVNQHVYHYPCSNVYVPRVFRNSHTLATPNLISKDAFVLPPKHVADILVAEYFQHIHPGFPIIDRDHFLSLYHDPTLSPPILLLQAVCLAASHVTKSFHNNQDLKVAFFRRAKALLDGRYEEDRMLVVQAAMLLTWFSDGGDDICANAWWWIGVAAKTAIGLGMHRDVRPSKMPQNDQRIWRIIWWCLVQLDCLVSLCYGRPQSINLDDCDVPALSLDDFDSSVSIRAANFVIHHTKLCVVVSDLVRRHFSVKARKYGPNRGEVLDIVDAALAEWLVAVPSDFQEHSRQTATDWDHWPSFLHLTYNTVLIQFHRPLDDSGPDPTSHSTANDEDICAGAASNIIRIFDQLEQHASLRLCWFWAPSSLFTAILELRGQLKCRNPILAFRIKEKYDAGLLSLHKLTRHWLYATSILRLFQSNSIEKSQKEVPSQEPPTTRPDQVAPEWESPAATVSSLGAISNSATQGMTTMLSQSHPEEMDWVRLQQYADPTTVNMHVEQNRWHNSLNEWQSVYWSDPLASIHLEDNFGQFRFDWPS